jgi:hypothetical protein
MIEKAEFIIVFMLPAAQQREKLRHDAIVPAVPAVEPGIWECSTLPSRSLQSLKLGPRSGKVSIASWEQGVSGES